MPTHSSQPLDGLRERCGGGYRDGSVIESRRRAYDFLKEIVLNKEEKSKSVGIPRPRSNPLFTMITPKYFLF